MGNFGSRRKSTGTEEPARTRSKQKKGKKASSSAAGNQDEVDGGDKFVSCPDLPVGGAVPYHDTQDNKVNITVYRSYGDLESQRSGSWREERPNIKIYRRSTGAMPKSATLPHNFHSRSPRSKSYAGSSGRISSGAYPELRRSKDTVDSGSDYLGSRRASSSDRYTLRRAPVTTADFPITADIKRRLEIFEEHFVMSLVSKYRELSDTLQVSALSIAIRKGSTGYQTVSLLDYLSGDKIPEDLLDTTTTKDEYILTVPGALLHGVAHVRRDKVNNMQLWTSLAGDVVTCVATEAANEIARIYEYQIAMVAAYSSIGVMAGHAADCVIEYIKSNSAFLDRNTAILGALYGRPFKDISRPKLISVIVGERELKWDLFDIFKNAGLRREEYLVQDDVLQARDEDLENTRSSDESESLPWKYYIAPSSDCLLYGYRGQVLEWNFVHSVYTLHAEDEDRFTREMTYHPEDFHKMYMPYRRLVGLGVMQNFCMQSSGSGQNEAVTLTPRTRPKKGLAEFVSVPQDGASGRDEVQPVYRPLHPAGDTLTFDNKVLDNADLARLQLDDNTKVDGASFKNVRLLLADVDHSKMERADWRGTDLSYSQVAVSDPTKLQKQQGVTVKHVTFNDSPTIHGGPEVDGTTTTTTATGRNRRTRTRARGQTTVTDSEGKTIDKPEEVIQTHERRIKEREEAKAAAEAAKPPPSPRSPTVNSTSITTVTTTSRSSSAAVKKIKKIKKKKQTSGSSPGSGRSGSASSPEVGVDARLNRSFSAGQYDRAPPLTSEVNVRQVNGEVIRPVVAQPQFAEVSVRDRGAPVYQSSPRQGSKSKSMSAADVNRSVDLRPVKPQRLQQQQQGTAAGNRTTFPRMTKSVSHHGQLTSTSQSGSLQGFYGGKRQLSQVEIEFIRKSQVFRMIQGLQMANLDSNLPTVTSLYLGRQQETVDVIDMTSSGGIVTITGCPGVGKSSFALSVADLMKSKYVVPLLVEARDAGNSHGLFKRMMTTFGLHFKPTEINLFYNWINCREQRFLFLLDNVDCPPDEDDNISELLDNLMKNIKNLSILCTSQRRFFKGKSTSQVYKLGDLREKSEDLLRQLIPDLHDEGIRELAEVCDHVPYAMKTAAKTLAGADIDSGKLFEDLTLNQNGTFSQSKQDELVASIAQDESDKPRLTKLVCCVKKIVDNLPSESAQILFRMSHVAHTFNASTTEAMTSHGTDAVGTAIEELKKAGLIFAMKDSPQFYCMPLLVRLIGQASDEDPMSSTNRLCQHFLDILKTICTKYHSKACEESLELFDQHFDNIVHVLRCVIEGDEVYEQCLHFGGSDYVMLLNETLPWEVYNELYSALYTQATERGDVVVQGRALCGMAYHFVAKKDYDAAKQSAEKAYDILHSAKDSSNIERAFCLQCMARATWHSSEELLDKERAMVLAKRALDIFKSTLGLRSVQTLYANELYGWMLMQRESYQTARHYYNVSDFLVKELLDEHPEMLDGYDCRRFIWDGLFLFARATDTAKKTCDVAKKYYGDHPVTATMTLRLCESIIKRGSLNDAIEASVTSVAMRVRTLGDHVDTGLAYKTLAYLMLRSGQYDEAVRFSQTALEIYEKVEDSTERMKIDVKNITAQARYRLEYKSSVFVELESKDASKPNIAAEESHLVNTSMISSVVSTEV